MDEIALRRWTESMHDAFKNAWESGDLTGWLDLHDDDWFADGHRTLDGGAQLRKRHIEKHIWSIREFFPFFSSSTLRARGPDLVLDHTTYSDEAGNTLEMIVCLRFRSGRSAEIHVFDVDQIDEATALFARLSSADDESS